ncbi:MAG: heavy-metal-associated domain-containing protein [Clostridia bacterium]|nr:heavy-metal-associated domain-containing protein [Clostridia bacterium]
MKELELNVIGMHCSGCENRIKNVVSEIKEVKKVEANHETGKVNVTLKKEVDEEIKNNIKTAIENLDGFEVV